MKRIIALTALVMLIAAPAQANYNESISIEHFEWERCIGDSKGVVLSQWVRSSGGPIQTHHLHNPNFQWRKVRGGWQDWGTPNWELEWPADGEWHNTANALTHSNKVRAYRTFADVNQPTEIEVTAWCWDDGFPGPPS